MSRKKRCKMGCKNFQRHYKPDVTVVVFLEIRSGIEMQIQVMSLKSSLDFEKRTSQVNDRNKDGIV